MVKFARDQGSNKAVANPVTRWLRDLMMPLFLRIFANPDALAWMYAHRIDWSQPVCAAKAHTP